MPSIQDIQRLAQMGAVVGSSSPAPTQTVTIVNPDSGNADGCLPCQDTGCTVAPTVSTPFDMGKFGNTNGGKIRFTVTNGYTQTVHFTLMSRLEDGQNTIIAPNGELGGANAADASIAGLVVNGVSGSDAWKQLLLSVTGGAAVSAVTLQANTAQGTGTANSDFVNQNLTIFHRPFDPKNNLITDTSYEPFCDYCTTNNNSTTVTHRYSVNAGITWRDGIDVTVPAGASNVIIEFCFGIIGLPNALASTVDAQMD
ncbi:MAG: hypothetical protein IT243_06085 [Bacteroidia bacterium]|nr:hypothetical protein [Bacteroidia bacterium]